MFDFASNESVAFIASTSVDAREAVDNITAHAFDVNGSKDNLSTLVVPLPAWGAFKLGMPNNDVHLM